MMNSIKASRKMPATPFHKEIISLRSKSIKMRKYRSLRVTDLSISRSPPKQGKDRIKRSDLHGGAQRKSSSQKMDNRSPNYMKPTSSSNKKKEDSQVSTHLPTTNNNQNRLQLKHGLKKTSMPGNRCLGTNFKEITLKSLSRCTSLRPKKTSMKAPGVPFLVVQNVTRATCSSTLKDSKFPDYVALHAGGTESKGTSAMKVCPYTYCSLNGHLHKSMPPLKRFLSAKRRSIKAQKSIKLRGNRGCKTKLALKSKSKINTGKHLVTQLISNGEVTSPSWSSRSWEGEQSEFLTGNFDDNFFVEIYANSLPDITYCDGSENAGLVENRTIELPQPIFDMKDVGESSLHTYEEVYSGSRHRGDEQTGDDCLQEAESIANGSSCASNIVDSDDDHQIQSIDFFIEDKEDRNASLVVPRFIHCGKEEEAQNADESNCLMPPGQLAMTSEVCSGSESNEDELDSILCAQEIEGTDDAPENVASSSTDLLDVDCVMRRTILNTSLMAETVDGREGNMSSDAEIPLDQSQKCQKNDSSPAQESTVLCETLEIDIPATQNDNNNIVRNQIATKTTGFIDLSPEDMTPLTKSSGTRVPSCLLTDIDDSKLPDDDQSDTQNVEYAETGEDCLLEAPPQNGLSCESCIADDKDDPDQQSFFLEYAQVVNASAVIPQGNDCKQGEENQHSGESCSALETNQPSLISKICVESKLFSRDSTLQLQENVEPPIRNGSSLTLVLDNEPDNQNTTLNMTLVGDEVYRDDCNSFNTEIPLHMQDESDSSPPEYSSGLFESLKVDIPASPSDEITIAKEETSTEITGVVDVNPEDMKPSTSNVVPLGSVQDIAEVICSPTLNKSKFLSYGESDLGSESDEAAKEDCLWGSKSAVSSSFSEQSIIDGVNNHQENQVISFSSDDAEVVNASVVAPQSNDCIEEENTPLDENNRSIQADQPAKVAKTCVDGESDKNQLVSHDLEMEEDDETRIDNGISTTVLGDESNTQTTSNATMMGDGVLDKEDSISFDFELPLNHSDKTDSSPSDLGDLSESLDIDISAVPTDNINTGKEEVQAETTGYVDLKPDDIKLWTTSFISGVPLCLAQDTAQERYCSSLEDLNSSDQKCMTDTEEAREDRLVEAGCEVNGLSPELCIVADEQDQHIDFSFKNAAESNTSIADPLVQQNQPPDENKSSIHADQPVMTVQICVECESDEGNLVSTLAVMKMEGNGESPTNNDSSCVAILEHEFDLVTTSDINALDEEPPVIEDSILSNAEVPPDHWEKSDSSPTEDCTDLSVNVKADIISSKSDATNMHSEEFHGETIYSSDLNPTELEAKDDEDKISKQGHVKVYVECELDEGELASTVSDMKMEDGGEALINNDSSCIVILEHELDIPKTTLDTTALDEECFLREDNIFFNAEIPPDSFEKTDSSPAEDSTNLSVSLEVHIPSPKYDETNLFREEIHTEMAGSTNLKPTESKDDEDKISKPDNGSSGGEVSTVPGSTLCQSNDAHDTEESLGHVLEVMAEPDDQACQSLRSPDKEISGMLEDKVENKEKVECAPNLVSAFPKVEDQVKSSEPGKILETQIHDSLMLICKAKDEIATENENLEDMENDTESLQSDTKKEKDCFGGIGGQPAQVECSISTSDAGTSARKVVDIHVSPEENEIRPSDVRSLSYKPSHDCDEKREKDYRSPQDSSDKTSQMQFSVVTKQIAEEHFLAARIKRPTRDDSEPLLCDARKGKGNKPTLPYDRLDVMAGQPTQFESSSSEADEGNCTIKTVNFHVPLEENESTPSNDANTSYTSPQGVEKREKVTSVQGSGKSAKLEFRADTKQDAQKPFLVFRRKHPSDIDMESLQSNATNKDVNDLRNILSGQPIQAECCSSAYEEGNCARRTVNIQVPLQGTESRLSDSHNGSDTSRKCGEKRKQHVSSESDSFDKATKVKFRVDIKQDKEEAFLASKIKFSNKEENKPMDEKDWSLLFSRCRSNLREITNFEGIDEYEDTSKEENPVTPSPNAKLRLTRCYSDSKNSRNSKGKNMVEVMSGSRKINPRKPKFLPILPWPLRENVVLRHRLVDQRKNPEEFMLDYALRQTVNKLAPTRKKRVAMLVAAFEKVIPLSKCEPYPRHHATRYSHVRTVQSCS